METAQCEIGFMEVKRWRQRNYRRFQIIQVGHTHPKLWFDVRNGVLELHLFHTPANEAFVGGLEMINPLSPV